MKGRSVSLLLAIALLAQYSLLCACHVSDAAPSRTASQIASVEQGGDCATFDRANGQPDDHSCTNKLCACKQPKRIAKSVQSSPANDVGFSAFEPLAIFHRFASPISRIERSRPAGAPHASRNAPLLI